MNSKGLVGKIILIVLLSLLIIGGGIAFYFYNYYVFKSARICVGEGVDSGLPCESYLDCLKYMNFSDDKLNGAPQFLKSDFDKVLRAAVNCDGTCSVGVVRGIDYKTGNLENLKNCDSDEQEFVIEIKGKEGLEILRWMKSRPV